MQIISEVRHLVFRIFIFLVVATAMMPASLSRAQQTKERTPEWLSLTPGVEYAVIPFSERETATNSLHVVRIDPRRARVVALAGADHGARSRTARQWCEEFGLVVVMNAGMYDVDAKTHVGYMRTPLSVNNKRWNKTYESVLLLDGTSATFPSARILDRSELTDTLMQSFGSVIQNLRLIKHPGINVWQQQPKVWSEAAIAEDRSGNILFLFLQKPASMHHFNENILRAGLGIVRAMHAEGGSEASLSICSEVKKIHLSGSIETGIREGSENMVQMAIPNVVGVRR
jgi:hypothetical protein